FVARLNTDVTGTPALVYGSYLGGTGADQGLGIALDSTGDGYVTGTTSVVTGSPSSATDFPRRPEFPGFQVANGGATDAFVVRITDIAKTADLSITKTVTGTNFGKVNAGGQFAYKLSVNNGGPSAASAIKVSDTLPAGVKLMGASGDGWTCSGTSTGPTTVTCTRDSLAAPTAPPPAKIAAPHITITGTAPL